MYNTVSEVRELVKLMKKKKKKPPKMYLRPEIIDAEIKYTQKKR